MLLDIGWLSVLIAFLTDGRSASLIVTPLNIAVFKGTKIAMECRSNATTNRTLQWRIKQDQTADDQTLFDGSELVGPFAELYELRKNGSKTLTLVMKATEETAKRYICEEIGFQSASAELVVLASEPVCSLINVTAADAYFQATMQCVVRYFGNWIPTMNWTQSYEVSTENSGNSARITESVTTITGSGVSKSLLIIEGKRGEMLIVYNCTTWFNLNKMAIQTTAINIPDYVYTWSSPAITLNTGKHAPSFVPLLTIAATLTVALMVTSTCLLILKRKLKVADEYAPENEVVLAERNVRLKCWSDGNGSLQWKRKQFGDEETSITYNHNTTSGNARITLNTTIDGQYDLHISSVGRSDAGTYTCITEKNSEVGDGSLITRRYEAQLVILTSRPNCTFSTATGKRTLEVNDYVLMQCYVQFVGDLVPAMKWRRGEESVAGAETNITKRLNSYEVKSSLLGQVNFMDDGVTFSCDTFFTPKVDNHSSDGYLTRATNIPDYKHTWTSPPINVSYGPRALAVHVNNMLVNGTIVTAGDQLKCHASGNPAPRYEWIIFAKHFNFTKQGPEFVFDVDMLCNCQLIVECKATNEFGEKRTRFNLTSSIAEDIDNNSMQWTTNIDDLSTQWTTCKCTIWTTVVVVMGITNIASIAACLFLFVKRMKAAGVTFTSTATTTTVPPAATTSSSEYAELHVHDPTRFQHNMPKYENVDLQEETTYTNLNVSPPIVIYANQL